MKKFPSLTHKRLLEVLHYDKDNGKFFWIKTWGKRLPGTPAGTLKAHGYITINVEGVRHYAHRLVWFYVTGSFPKEIDHRNGIRHDNRWANLRIATRTQNNGNRKKNPTPFPKGVTLLKECSLRPYMARIQVKRKQIILGYYESPEEAHLAYLLAAHKYFGEFTRAS